ncbi:MAG: hypothetical protein JSU06_03025 [Actinobacteria bacterium]|nr:hypothetical protein [Actinomycetota bacterium]
MSSSDVAVPTAQKAEPFLLTGDEYRASIRDGRQVYYRGERIDDVTVHPVTRGAVSQLAAVYDAQHAPETQDILTYVGEDGKRLSKAWMLPRSPDDLVGRRECAEWIARQNFGTFGRHLDMAPLTQVGALANIGIFREEVPRYADNIAPYIKEAHESNRMIAGCFVDPQGKRAKRRSKESTFEEIQPETGFPSTLRVTREDSSGFWVNGPKAVGTALPYSQDCYVASVPGKAPEESFWFIIPVASEGLKFICRKTVADLNESRFEHPLAARGDEIDAMVLFEDVFVPWERVFALGTGAVMQRFGQLGVLEYWYTMIRVTIKAEMIAAVVRMVVDTLDTRGIQLVRQTASEVNHWAIMLRSLIDAAEAKGSLNAEGVFVPSSLPITAGRAYHIEMYPRIQHILQELCGQGSMMRLSEADYRDPEIGARLDWFLEGEGMSAEEKARLFNLVWDLSGDGYAARTALFEKLNGFPLFILKEWLFNEYSSPTAESDVRKFLEGV